MGVLATNNKQLIFIYSKDSWLGKNLLHHIENLDTQVRIININEECLTDIIWIEIASLLEVDVKDLFDSNYLTLSEGEKACTYTAGDWLNLIIKNPGILQNPIAINGIKAKILYNRQEVFKFYKAKPLMVDKLPYAVSFAKPNNTLDIKNTL